jgi:hypothetical protein
MTLSAALKYTTAFCERKQMERTSIHRRALVLQGTEALTVQYRCRERYLPATNPGTIQNKQGRQSIQE